MRWLVIPAVAVAGLYAVVVGWLFTMQRSLIYPFPADQVGVAVDGMERVALRTSDGLTLRAAYAPAERGRRTIVFFHGNGDGLVGADLATRQVRAAGYGVLLLEYRGYGGNPGTPTEQGLYRDGRAALDWLARRGVGGEGTVLVGNSLGSGVASQLATERAVAGLALVSPFTSMTAAVRGQVPYVPVGWLLRDRYDSLAKLRGRRLPLLVLHGLDDKLIAASQGERLAAAVPRSRLILVRNVGHELAYLPGTQRELIDWLGRLPPAAQRVRQPAGSALTPAAGRPPG